MFINEISEPQLLVIYPGRFQPFHKGHHAVFDYLVSKFGRNNVWIATSNKVEPPKSPFSFAEKAYFMQPTGVPADRIIQATSPYRIPDVVAGGNISVSDPTNCFAIFAISEKDMAEDPRFASFVKKDGTPAYFQKFENVKDMQNMEQHAYIMTVPTFDFDVLGEPMRSGTELRKMYIDADEKTRQNIIKDLFGKYTREAEHLMTNKLAPANPTTPLAPVTAKGKVAPTEKRPTKLPKTVSPEGGIDKSVKTAAKKANKALKETGGVGVVKGGNDPRYSMSTAGDQNAVDGNTLGQEMKAFGLVGRKSPGANRQQRPVKQAIGKGINESNSFADTATKMRLNLIEILQTRIDGIKRLVRTGTREENQPLLARLAELEKKKQQLLSGQ